MVNYPELRPTYTHEAICKLVEMGILKHLISQNCDGLHRLSGIPRQKMSELHGNSFEAKCEICDAHYEFPFVVRTLVLKKGSPNYKRCPTCRLCHRTKKKCEREVSMYIYVLTMALTIKALSCSIFCNLSWEYFSKINIYVISIQCWHDGKKTKTFIFSSFFYFFCHKWFHEGWKNVSSNRFQLPSAGGNHYPVLNRIGQTIYVFGYLI